MADLPPNIGFDDEPVILLNYVTLEDTVATAKPLIMSKGRNRVRSDSSIVSSSGAAASKRRGNKSSVSSLSDASSLDPSDTDKLTTPFHSQESDPSPLHSSSSKASPLKRLDEEEKNCLKSLEEVDSSSSVASNEGRKLGDTPSPTERDGLKEKRKKSFTVNVEPKVGPSYQRQLSSPSHELSSLLLERDKEIASLRRQLQEIQATTSQPRVSFENSISQAHMPHSSGYGSETLETPPPSSSLTESGHTPQRSTLQRLLEEQQVSYRLKTDNSELRSKVLILESEVDNLRQQNLVQLQQLEQATTSLAAASVNSTHSATPSPQKTKKKSSFFGLRRSGRKSSMGAKNGSGSSIEQSPRLKRPGFHSSSNLSLEGSLSEHDISSLLARKPEARVGGEFQGNSIDFERLQMTLKLSMEEKSELGRQLELLREELKHQEDKREELLKERISKDDFMEMSMKLEETLQALQLATREKELLESEGEGLKYELETLRSERDSLTALLKGKEVKAVLKEKQEMDFLRSENKALMSEVRTLISNSDNLETSLSQLKREMVARDVRGHELKLKIKKLEKENGELKTLAAAAAIKEDAVKSKREEKKGEGNRNKKIQRVTHEDPVSPVVNHSPSEKPIFTISPSFYSPDQQSPSTGQPAMKPYNTKPSPFLTASTGETHHVSTYVSAHERTQSEDLTSVGMAPPLQMIRTSSGGTKFVAVQVTLPTKENATKVLDKSFSVPSLEEVESTRNFSKRKNSDSTLGTFVGAMSGSSNANGNKPGVNSLVKMFELGKGSKSGEDGSNKENVVGGRGSGVLSGSLIESSLEESIEEEKLMTEQKTQSYHTRSASSSSSSSSNKGLRSRKHSSTGSLKEEQERKKVEEEEAKQLKKKEEERKRLELEAKRKEEAKERQRKEHEAKERQKKEERLRKEQEKQRKEQEAREKREKFKREQEAKERERKEQEAKERERREQEAKERERKEQEAKEKEKREQEAKEKEKREQEAKKREQEAKERERREKEARKEQEREAKEREEKKLKDEERRKRDELTADRSQTWPPKAENIATPSTNTLPGTSTHRPETTPAAQPNPQPINKPKPPPGVGTRSKTQANLFSSTQGDSSLTGVVANLRSSWEKKSQMGMVPQAPSHPRLSKAPSVPISYPRMERTSSLNVPAPPSSQVAAPPFVKTGSGPAGTVISSPSDSKTTNMSIKRVGYASDSNATPTNPTHTQQNGHVNLRNKPTVVRTTSGDGSGSGEVVLRGHTSPRLARPASLYVTSTSSGPPPSVNFGTPTSEKRLSSLITKLQVKESSNTVPTTSPSSSSFIQNQSPVLSRSTGGMAITPNNKNAVPPLTRPHSFYAGSSPKPLTRAASLASPLDRRTKKNMLLRWCQIMTQDYHNIMISNFGESFSDGLAFCALLHHFVPDKIPYETLDGVNQKRNFEIAFSVAEGLGIPSLLDVDDMVEMAIPDWMSVMTYVSYIYNHFSKKESQYS